MNKILKKTLILIGIAIFALGTDHLVYTNTPAQAADSNVGNGITVDSTLDTPDDNVGDNICDDGDANCTLRAAIQEANSNPDITTISFNITGVADFTGWYF